MCFLDWLFSLLALVAQLELIPADRSLLFNSIVIFIFKYIMKTSAFTEVLKSWPFQTHIMVLFGLIVYPHSRSHIFSNKNT